MRAEERQGQKTFKTTVNMPTICSMFYESPSKNNLAIIPFGTLLVVFDTEVLYFPGLDLSAQLYSIQWYSRSIISRVQGHAICDAIRSG